MDDQVKLMVRQILTEHLEMNKHRKTTERYAILDAIYNIKGLFTMEELGQYLAKNSFQVSRATLYNAMRLFIELRLVMKHSLQDNTMYEASYSNRNHCHQICTVCGKISEARVPEVMQAVKKARLKRFRKDTYSLLFYGICSTCQAKITRRKSQGTKDDNPKDETNESRQGRRPVGTAMGRRGKRKSG